MHQNKPWSDEEIQRLFELRDIYNYPYTHIASVLGRTTESVRQKVKEMAKLQEAPDAPCANTLWNDIDLTRLYELRAVEGLPFKEIALNLGRTEQSVKKKYNGTDWSNFVQNKEYKSASTESESIRKAKKESVAKMIDRKYETNNLSIEILAERIESVINRLPKIDIEKPTRDMVGSKTPEEAVLLLSDMHIGEEYTYEETGGVTEFNFNKIKKQVSNLKYAVHDIVNLHNNLYDIPKLHVACLGDIVAGMNQTGSWTSNYISMNIMDQMFNGLELLSDALAYWLGLFDEVVFYGLRGNHGRAAKRGVEKDFVNWDYLCYRYLQERFCNNDRICFNIPKTWWLFEEISNHGFLMVHGEDVKSSSNTAMKALAEFEQSMSGIINRHPDYTLSGHFHNASEFGTNRGRVIINGSFVGGDIYSMQNMHCTSRPEQVIFGVHPRRGVTWKYNINLDQSRQ